MDTNPRLTSRRNVIRREEWGGLSLVVTAKPVGERLDRDLQEALDARES